MGEAPVYNTVITLTFDSDSETKDALIEDWLLKDSILVAYRLSSITEDFADSIDGLNVVVLVMIASAGLLAFVVLYNLTNINISERVREIATIKVLGFYNNEVSKFVFRENIVLSVIGLAVGSAFGVILHKFVVQTSEVDLVMFGRGVGFVNFIYAGLLTLLFTFAVNFIMHYRLKKISMVESLKSLD
jgi:putative ABC transport system permease protein